MDGNESHFRNSDRNIQEGDLVRWFELFHEGIVKDAGLGSVLNIREIQVDGPTRYIQYEVWRWIPNDIIWFGPEDVERLDVPR